MKREEVFLAWAPEESIWSPWVLPVPFAQLNCVDFPPASLDGQASLSMSWMAERKVEGQAYVFDIPGGDAMRCGIALADRGIRPVPVIDGSPGPGEFYCSREPMSLTSLGWHPDVVVDMTELLRALCAGAVILREKQLSPNAMPAFLLDAMRMTGHRVLADDAYDNRWQVFAQDFPSAKFMQEQGVKRVLLVQERKGQPQEDLAHVLLRWQEGGIKIESVGAKDGSTAEEIQVTKPSMFRRLWYRALSILRLRRNWSGGFGGFPVSTSG